MNELVVPNYKECFMVPRGSMPQIASGDVKSFVKSIGAKYDIELVKSDTLKPTQSEFNVEKIKGMDIKGKCMPVLISSDDYVLDGHHRWLANHFDTGIQPVIRLPYAAAQCISKMHEFEKSFKKEIHEDAAPVTTVGNGAMDSTIAPVSKKRQRKLVVLNRKNAKLN